MGVPFPIGVVESVSKNSDFTVRRRLSVANSRPAASFPGRSEVSSRGWPLCIFRHASINKYRMPPYFPMGGTSGGARGWNLSIDGRLLERAPAFAARRILALRRPISPGRKTVKF